MKNFTILLVALVACGGAYAQGFTFVNSGREITPRPQVPGILISSFTPSVNGEIGWDGSAFLFREGGVNRSLSSGGITGTLVSGEVVYATGSSTADSDAQFKWTTGTKIFTLGDGGTTQTRMLHDAGTLTAGNRAVALNGTLAAGNGSEYGTTVTMTSSGTGTAASQQSALRVTLGSGYSGVGTATGLWVINSSDALGTTPLLHTTGDPDCNIGVLSQMVVTAPNTGTHIGVYGRSFVSGATLQIGIAGVTGNSGATTNVGVFGSATGGLTAKVGVFAGLIDVGVGTPSFTTAALLCDNGGSTSPIIVARENGTTRWTVAGYGGVGHTLATLSAGQVGYSLTGTMSSTGALDQSLAAISATQNGTASSDHVTLKVTAGGTKSTAACVGIKSDVDTQNPGTALSLTGTAPTGNIAGYFESGEIVTGNFIGMYGKAHSGTSQVIGTIGDANGGTGATSIGVLGNAHPTNGTTRLAGYFGLHSSTPTFASGALMADNGSTAESIFVARDNGTAVHEILDGGEQRTSSNLATIRRNLAGTEVWRELPLRVTTTNSATPTELTVDDGGTLFLQSMSDGDTWGYEVLVVGRGTAGTNDNKSALYKINFLIQRTGSTSAIVGTPSRVIEEEIAGWDCNAEADDTNDRPAVKVTGDAASTILWRGWAKGTKVN